MADLTFLFAQMGAGKTASLLSTAFHLRHCGQQVTVLTCNDRTAGKVTSRLGIDCDAITLDPDDDPVALLADQPTPDHVLVDEAQFLTPTCVDRLAHLVDEHDIDITCYGLRTDFTARLFDGAARLLAIADRVEQLQVQARCWCGRPATHNARLVNGIQVADGAQVIVDDGTGEVTYQPLCRRHFTARQPRHQRPANARPDDATAPVTPAATAPPDAQPAPRQPAAAATRPPTPVA